MFRYILRYYIDPGFAEDKRIAELLELCKKGRIEEVMFFYNPEELFQGYPDDAEVESWFALAKKVKAALDGAGILMSINPWTTTVHVSRGRKFTEKQHVRSIRTGRSGLPRSSRGLQRRSPRPQSGSKTTGGSIIMNRP